VCASRSACHKGPRIKDTPKKQPRATHPNLPAMIIACITALPPRTVSPTSLYSSWACAGYTRSTCSTCRCFVLSKHRPHHYVEVTQAGSHRSCVSVVPLQKHHQQESSQGQLSAHRPCHRPKKRLGRATGRLADPTSNIPPSRAPSATPTPKEPRRRSLRIKKKASSSQAASCGHKPLCDGRTSARLNAWQRLRPEP